jgi:hypothetical protein
MHTFFFAMLVQKWHTKIKVMNSFLIRVAWVSGNTSLFFQVWYIFVFCFRQEKTFTGQMGNLLQFYVEIVIFIRNQVC